MVEKSHLDATHTPSELRALTWNIRGLNDHRKVHKVLHYLKRHNIDLALLQETHLPLDSPILKSRGLCDNINVAGFTTHARGVLTWVNPNSKYTLTLLHDEPQGRYVISRCTGNKLDCIIVNIYGPNYDCPEFYRSVAKITDKHADKELIWGGDFNLIRDSNLDRSGGPTRQISAAAKNIESIMVCNGLKDVWHYNHPERGGYTHYSAYHNLHTRIAIG